MCAEPAQSAPWWLTAVLHGAQPSSQECLVAWRVNSRMQERPQDVELESWASKVKLPGWILASDAWSPELRQIA